MSAATESNLTNESIDITKQQQKQKIHIGNIRDKNKLNYQSKIINELENKKIKSPKTTKDDEPIISTEIDGKQETIIENDNTKKETEKSSNNDDNKSKSSRKKPSDNITEKMTKTKTEKQPSKTHETIKSRTEKSSNNSKKSKKDEISESKQKIVKPEDKRLNRQEPTATTKDESTNKPSETIISVESTQQEIATKTNKADTESENKNTLITKRKHRESYTNDDSIHNRSSKYHRSKSKETSNRASNTSRNYDPQSKYDDSNFKNQTRYPRFKYQGFRPNYRFYPYNYHYGAANNEYNELFLSANNEESSTTVDNEIPSIDDTLDVDNQSDFFIQTSSSMSNQQKKISSKIIDLLDIDWSILNNKYFNSLNKTNRDCHSETVYGPSFILSTIGTINDCIDEKSKEKLKDFIGKDKLLKNEDAGTFISGLNSIKNKIKNKTVNNNSFKVISGICMRNDIERRKSLFFHQINKQIEDLSLENKKSEIAHSFGNSCLSTNDILNDHISFYQHTLKLLKDDDCEPFR